MHEMLSRKERQLEKFEYAAKNGQMEVTLIVYPSEARYWIKQGGIFCNLDNVKIIDEKNKLGYYTFSFDNSHLLHSLSVVNDIRIKENSISYYNFGEKLFIQAKRVLSNK